MIKEKHFNRTILSITGQMLTTITPPIKSKFIPYLSNRYINNRDVFLSEKHLAQISSKAHICLLPFSIVIIYSYHIDIQTLNLNLAPTQETYNMNALVINLTTKDIGNQILVSLANALPFIINIPLIMFLVPKIGFGLAEIITSDTYGINESFLNPVVSEDIYIRKTVKAENKYNINRHVQWYK